MEPRKGDGTDTYPFLDVLRSSVPKFGMTSELTSRTSRASSSKTFHAMTVGNKVYQTPKWEARFSNSGRHNEPCNQRKDRKELKKGTKKIIPRRPASASAFWYQPWDAEGKGDARSTDIADTDVVVVNIT